MRRLLSTSMLSIATLALLAAAPGPLAPGPAAAQVPTGERADPRNPYVVPNQDPRGVRDRRTNDRRIQVPQYRSPYPEPLRPYYGPYYQGPDTGGRVRRNR
jgi:hypothetical protein